ncbi:MAG: O-antigen ligase family protein [Flavobacteriales bacterium]|nr:O-antigen ligase family protein [Flavobacteriales bacterium]
MSLSAAVPMREHDVFRSVHVVALSLCAIMLPWSTAFLSIAQLLMVVNWLAEGVVRKDLAARFRTTFTSWPALVFLSFFGLHVVGLVWTTDMEWGTDLVRILLPVLSFGAVLAGTRRLDRSEFRLILRLGAWSVIASTMACSVLRTGDAMDYRSLSMFISHIRLSLLLCLSIVIFLLDRDARSSLRIAGYSASVWALYFIDALGSIQGFIILGVLSVVFVWRWAAGRGRGVRWSVQMGIVLLLVAGGSMVLHLARGHQGLPDPKNYGQAEYTAGGERYIHDLSNPQTENGTYVWTYIAWGELRSAWPLRSGLGMDDLDGKGHPIWSTLVRYLASKGERKDSMAVMALSEADVRAIEQGVPSVSQEQRSGIRERIEEVLFELEHYQAYGAADGHSVAMRLEFLKAGAAIAKRNWTMGVGTGDTKIAFAQQYERMESMLSEEWRHRAHNEYLTLWISFGVCGLLWSLFAWWWPAQAMGAWHDPYFIAWSIIFGISCLTDDTIETQAGATFFALFYALFVFASPRPINAGR